MKIFKINRKNFHRAAMIAAEAIKTGRVVVCPTDTVYGLLADATNKRAVEKLFEIKKRPKGKAVPIFVKDIKTAKKFAVIGKKQEKILKEKWPGKFTFVFKKKKAKIFGTAPKTIGLRIPNYKLVNILLAKLNRPLTGTSANISGKPASTKIEDILKQFDEQKTKPDLAIDSGNLPKSSPSAIIDFTGKMTRILRKGDVGIKLNKPNL